MNESPMEALNTIKAYICELEDENESLKAEVNRLLEEIDTIRENINDWYKPRSPYECIGMSRSDFY